MDTELQFTDGEERIRDQRDLDGLHNGISLRRFSIVGLLLRGFQPSGHSGVMDIENDSRFSEAAKVQIDPGRKCSPMDRIHQLKGRKSVAELTGQSVTSAGLSRSLSNTSRVRL